MKATRETFTRDGIGTLLDCTDWAILTAENPAGVQATKEYNAHAMLSLDRVLVALGLPSVRLTGTYNGIWENSVAVWDITEKQAKGLGGLFSQETVLTHTSSKDIVGFSTVHLSDEQEWKNYSRLPDGTYFRLE